MIVEIFLYFGFYRRLKHRSQQSQLDRHVNQSIVNRHFATHTRTLNTQFLDVNYAKLAIDKLNFRATEYVIYMGHYTSASWR